MRLARQRISKGGRTSCLGLCRHSCHAEAGDDALLSSSKPPPLDDKQRQLSRISSPYLADHNQDQAKAIWAARLMESVVEAMSRAGSFSTQTD